MKTTKTFTLPDLPAFTAAKSFDKGFYLGLTFTEHFLAKKESKAVGGTFKLSTLEIDMLDKDIIQELGSDYTVTLSQFHAFLKIADKSGCYIAYCADTEGTIWAVDCCRSDRGWDIYAGSVADPDGDGWDRGYQVFSRDSEPSETLSSETLNPSDSLILEKEYVRGFNDAVKLMRESLPNELTVDKEQS